MLNSIEDIFDPSFDLPFWDLVALLGWGSKTTDHKTLRNRVGAASTAEERAGLRSTIRALNEALKQTLYAWEERSGLSVGLGDDGRSDLHLRNLSQFSPAALSENGRRVEAMHQRKPLPIERWVELEADRTSEGRVRWRKGMPV